jgi:uncharacterized protein YeaC (DUF1315 family)
LDDEDLLCLYLGKGPNTMNLTDEQRHEIMRQKAEVLQAMRNDEMERIRPRYQEGNTMTDTITRLMEDAKDAARYRWLRDAKMLRVGPIVGARGENKGVRYILSTSVSVSVSPGIEALDAAIDEAMEKT